MKSRFNYVGIRVKDLEKSIDFYTRILGMQVLGRARIEQTKGETVGLHTEGVSLFSNSTTATKTVPSTPSMSQEKDWIIWPSESMISVKLWKKPKQLVIQPFWIDRWAYIEDPNGIWTELFQ